MPRLTITLPDELRRGQQGETGSHDRSSRRLGSGIEGADERSQQVVRWLECWANSDD
jgi:hypothetical protein